jgi:LysR family nitrogen assimilation transcriptional regulator
MGESLLGYVDQVREEVTRAAEVPAGKVTVGMPPSISPILGPVLMEECWRRFPEMSVRVTEGLSVFLAEWLNLSKIDLAVLTDPGDVPTLHTTTLVREEFVLVGSPEQMPSGLSEVPLAQLVDHRLVISPGFRRLIDCWTVPRGIELNYAMEFDSVAMIKEMILRGLGLSIMPYASVHKEASERTLAVIPIVEPVMTRDLVLAVNARRPTSAAMKAAAAVITDTLREIPVRPAGIVQLHVVKEGTKRR